MNLSKSRIMRLKLYKIIFKKSLQNVQTLIKEAIYKCISQLCSQKITEASEANMFNPKSMQKNLILNKSTLSLIYNMFLRISCFKHKIATSCHLPNLHNASTV